MKIIKDSIQLNEMAYERSDAIDKCASHGKRFIEHFHKIMLEGKDSNTFHHHCSEMQAFYDEVKIIKLKPRSKYISADNLINWFFTIGSDIETVVDEEYQETYEQLCIALLSDRFNTKVEDILNNLL